MSGYHHDLNEAETVFLNEVPLPNTPEATSRLLKQGVLASIRWVKT
jgi:hypothetical protein